MTDGEVIARFSNKVVLTDTMIMKMTEVYT